MEAAVESAAEVAAVTTDESSAAVAGEAAADAVPFAAEGGVDDIMLLAL